MGGGSIPAAVRKLNKHNNKSFPHMMSTFQSGDGDETHEDVIPSEETVLPDIEQFTHLSTSPLISSYNDSMMRSLVDAVHTLRCMNVIEEGITLPTIVVIGDQSSGKSSVIESLTGISLPRGQGMCTRVPLIMKLQHHSDVSELHLEYQGKSIQVNETPISEAINLAMDKIVGNEKEISDVPLTIVIKKNNVPDLTIVDLPGIPLDDQSRNIYAKILDIIEKYIKSEETLILNVISATADILTCESMRISKKFDKCGQRTLHVFTKSDKATKDMVAVVTTNIGADYVCVRNQLGDETFEEARTKEADLIKTHHLFSKIDRSILGINILAERLVLLQLVTISKCFGMIVSKINEDINMCVLEQSRSQQHFITISEAMPTLMEIIKMSEKSLSKVAITCEFDEFPDEAEMHCYTRLVDMLSEFSQQLKNNQVNENVKMFLTDEILLLQEGNGSEQVFNLLFQKKITGISGMTDSFVSRVWDYVEVVIVKVLSSHTRNYPQLLSSRKKAAKIFSAKMKESFRNRMMEFLEMKKMESYARDPRVISSWNKLKGSRRILSGKRGYELFYDVEVCVVHLRDYLDSILNEAYDIKTRIAACLEMVLKNVIDLVELDLRSMVCRMVENEMKTEMVNELKTDDGNRYKPMLKESPLMTTKRWKLKNRVELLEKLKKVVEKIMDEISFHGY